MLDNHFTSLRKTVGTTVCGVALLYLASLATNEGLPNFQRALQPFKDRVEAVTHGNARSELLERWGTRE